VSTPALIDFCAELKADILTQCRAGVSIGIGRPYKNYADIAVSYREAEAATRYRHYAGYNSVIPLQYMEPLNNITYRYPIEKEVSLVYSAVAGEYERCRELVAELMNSLRECGELPALLMSKIALDIIVSINRLTEEQRIAHTQNNPFKAFFPAKDIFDIKTIDDAANYLNTALEKYCAYMNEIRNKSKIELLEAAKKYIEENYFENITLASLSNKLGATGEFLGKVFVENEKKSFYDYIIGVRLQKAKELMTGAGLSDEEVAEKVGYNDVRHFRSVFKQYENVYTHEYRTLKKV